MSTSESATKLFKAIEDGDADVAVGLIQQDAALAGALNPDGVGPIAASLYSFKRPIAEKLVAAGVKPNFFEACALGDVTLANAYLSEDASQINSFSADGFTPLTLAAAFGGPEVVRLLMQHGADPSLRANHAFIKVTPLHAAVFGNRTDVVIALLEQGANPNDAQPGGFTALHGAAQNGNKEMVTALLDAGADPLLKTEQGKSAANLAQEAGHNELALSLA